MYWASKEFLNTFECASNVKVNCGLVVCEILFLVNKGLRYNMQQQFDYVNG